MNYGFVIDNRKCIGCHACTVACKAEHDVPIGVNRTWVKYIEKGSFPNTRRTFTVLRCNHCDDAPCVKICPVGALFNREDGIVDFNNERCIGCKSCIQSCPYDAIYIDPESQTAAKCNYCAHRVDLGLKPACVNVCPEQAIISGDMENPESEISKLLSRELVQARKVDKGTIPKLYYINGDVSSLNPLAAYPSDDYQQVSQAAGVGHFAKYAEKRLSKVNPEELAARLKENPGEYANESPQKYGACVPMTGRPDKNATKAWSIVREIARRVHDAPVKGVIWGWEVPAYLTAKAVGSGVVFIATFASLFGLAHVGHTLARIASGIGLLFLIVTTFFLVKDLDRPMRFLYVILRPQFSSWLTRGGIILQLFGAILTVYIGAQYFELKSLEYAAEWGAFIISVPVAVYTAFLLAQAKGRDFWQSPILPIHMIAHMITAGAGSFAILMAFLDTSYDWENYVRIMFMIGIAFNLNVLLAELTIAHPTAESRLVAKMISKGRFALLFYTGSVIIGNLIPIALLLTGNNSLFPIAGALAIIGIYVTEHIWIRGPQLVPLR